MGKLTISLVCVYALAVVVCPATAAMYLLEDRNSSAVIDDGSQNGMDSWIIDGTENLFQQWFWYRVGNQVDESSLDTLGPPIGFVHSNSDLDPGKEHLVLQYAGAGFVVTVTFDLNGGVTGSNTANISEVITIDNIGSVPLDFHFFQYVDFNLLNNSGGDVAQILNANTVEQTSGQAVVSETVVTPAPSHHEVAISNATLLSFSDGVATTLSDASGPLGPADVTWAFQWDFTILAGETVQVGKDKQLIIPEPATLGLLMLGGLALLRRRR